MSAVPRQRGLRAVEVPGRPVGDAARVPMAFEIRWMIAPNAVAPVWDDAGESGGASARPSRVELVAVVTTESEIGADGTATGKVRHVLEIEGRASRDLGSMALSIMRDPRGWIHADSKAGAGCAGGPARFSCTLRVGTPRGDARVEMMFARSPVIVDLGISGGRFDRPALGEVRFDATENQQ